MSTAWWEKVTQRASVDVQRRGLNELWAERTLPQGLLAAVSIRQQRLSDVGGWADPVGHASDTAYGDDPGATL